MAKKNLTAAILNTVCYADIFAYPLNLGELWKWLISPDGGYQLSVIKNTIPKLKTIKEQNGFYFLKSRDKLVGIRKERKEWSLRKLKIAQKIARVLKLIPSVKLVGITGALSMNNAQKYDDIDLFIITSKNLLWTTRLLTVLIVEITGRRRRPNEKYTNNKICLNMFIDEDHLSVPRKERDLFSAHEVVQMKPLCQRNNTYLKFIKANEWIAGFLPNALNNHIKSGFAEAGKKNHHYSNSVTSFAVNILEFIPKFLQLQYMRNRRTTEFVSDGFVRFHPQDARVWILEKYRKRLSGD